MTTAVLTMPEALPLTAPSHQSVTVRSDVPAPDWDHFVGRASAASGYHLAVWTQIIEEAFGHETQRLAAQVRGEIVGVLPLVFFSSRLFGRFAVSMPFLNDGGILSSSADARDALLAAAVAETRRRNGSYVELRHSARMFAHLPSKAHKVRMFLPLRPTVDEQWQRLDRKLRNQIRKAEKSGVRMTEGGAELIEPFYQVFARNMRDLGTPVYSVKFFQSVLRHLPGSTRILCAWSGDTPIAASIVVGQGATLEVPWASAVRDFNPLCPNVLLYWTMVQYAIGRGYERFDFGRSTPNEGTFYFKRQWGAEPHAVAWEDWTATPEALPDLSPKNPRFERAIAMWQKLPVPVTRIAGPWIVKNIP